MSTEDAKLITVKKLPFIWNKNIILKKGTINRNIRVVKSLQNSVQEDVIYTSSHGDFMSGEALSMTIVNQLNTITKSCTTIANCQSHAGEFFVKTSEEITNLIGRKNYDILFSSLCSILSQELKIRSIYSLLTVPKKNKSVSCQTENHVINGFGINSVNIGSFTVKKDSFNQTDETYFEDYKKFKPRRRNRRHQAAPYVVKEPVEQKKPKRVVISPKHFVKILCEEDTATKAESQATEPSLPELGSVFDEDSNNSVCRLSALSVPTIPDPIGLLNKIDKHTRDISNEVVQQDFKVTEQDQHQNFDLLHSHPSNEKLPFGMKEFPRSVPPEQRIKLLVRQGLNDLKYCLTRDNEGHLPIHVAVLSNDVDLLRRQCLVLKMRDTSVDITADGLTPLRMSLFQENTELTAVLLNFGADPLDADEEDRTPFHVAAEMGTDHLQVLVNYCQQNARKILQENEELWKPEYENKPDEELIPILLTCINRMYDSQGYTPLMLASKLGKYTSVLTLVESSRVTVNLTMPNTGNTALYLAVGAACMDSAERGNKTKVVDHFSRTIEILVENGADPNIENFAGSSINDLLTEFNISELSMLIANKLTSIRYFDGQLPNGIKGSDFMLFKSDSGKVDIKGVKDKKKSPKTPQMKPGQSSTITNKTSPIILENVSLKPPVKVNNTSPIILKPSTSVTPAIFAKQPVIVGTAKVGNSTIVKQENVNATQAYTPIVKNFKLSSPIIIKSGIANNKRKLDIVVEPAPVKKTNKND